MNKLDMGIEELNLDVKEYENVIIVSPIWVFDVASTIRTLCKKIRKESSKTSSISKNRSEA